MSSNWPEKYEHHPTPDSPADRREFNLLHKYSELDYTQVNVDEAWKNLHTKIEKTAPSRKYNIYWKIAAMLILVGSIAFAVYEMEQPAAEKLVEVTTGDVIKTIQLPDGSIVTMADDSRLSYSESNFRESRNISFEGEAFFEVVKDNSTFSISTPGAKVQVLGTSFNLETNNDIRVFVNTGLVSLNTQKDSTKVSPGELASAKKSGEIMIIQNTDPNLISWKTGVFTFDDMKLQEAFKYLEKYYNINFTATSELKACTITASFEKKPLSEVVKVLATILNAKGQINDKEVNFTGTGCK